MQAIPQREEHVVQQHLVLLGAAHHVDGHVRLHLVEHHPVVVEQDVAVLLGRLGQEALLEARLGGLVRVGVLGGGARRCYFWVFFWFS